MARIWTTIGGGAYSYGEQPDRRLIERAAEKVTAGEWPFYSVWAGGEDDDCTRPAEFLQLESAGAGATVVYRVADEGGSGSRWSLSHADGSELYAADECVGLLEDYLATFRPPAGAALRRHPDEPPLPEPMAYTLSARSSFFLTDIRWTYREVLRRRLAGLDAGANFSFTVWPVPPRVRTLQGLERKFREAGSYLQSAGAAGSLVIEWRDEHDDGSFDHYAVGRPGGSRRFARDGFVRWQEHEMRVRPHEVFTAEQAADVYLAYARTSRPPVGFELRRLTDLSSPGSL